MMIMSMPLSFKKSFDNLSAYWQPLQETTILKINKSMVSKVCSDGVFYLLGILYFNKWEEIPPKFIQNS